MSDILFFDTETTGFARFDKPADHPDQPHLVQLAAQLCRPDGRVISSMNVVVNNEGVEIPEKVAAIHGITTEMARHYGIHLFDALKQFEHLLSCADTVVAHNIKFDLKIIEAAVARSPGASSLAQKHAFCTMESAKPVVKMPPTARMSAAGFGGFKPPKLEECIRHFFGETLEGAHDAMVDVDACRRVYFHLKTLEQTHA